MKKLGNSQLQAFDTEYVNEQMWKIVKEQIDKDFPNGNFTFLDIGGGNGKFTDRLLITYPRSRGSVLDNSELLLSRNQPHERKTLIFDTVENIRQLNQKYDLICFNWILHHLVGHSYAQSLTNIRTTLNSVIDILKNNGKISIFENMYNGLLCDGLPSYLIFHLTSLKAIASITKRMGANTAGVGVCFLSKQQWLFTIDQGKLEVLKYLDDDKWAIPLAWNMFLHIKNIRVGHFWLGVSKDG